MAPHKKSRKRSHEEDTPSKKRKSTKKSKSKKYKRASSSSGSESSSNFDSHKKKSKREKKKKSEASSDIPLALMEKSKTMAPMTKEEWEKRQSVVRRVYDESTGRHRLIKGDGEVIEEMVSRDRHKSINQQATRGDGEFFQSRMAGVLKK